MAKIAALALAIAIWCLINISRTGELFNSPTSIEENQ